MHFSMQYKLRGTPNITMAYASAVDVTDAFCPREVSTVGSWEVEST